MPVKPLPASSLPDHHCPPGLKRIYFRDLDVGKVRDDRYVKVVWTAAPYPAQHSAMLIDHALFLPIASTLKDVHDGCLTHISALPAHRGGFARGFR